MVSRQDDRGNGQLLRRFLGLLSRFHHIHQFALQLLVVHELHGERMTQGAGKALQVLRLHIHGDFPIGRGLEDQGCLVFFQIHVCALLQFLFFLYIYQRDNFKATSLVQPSSPAPRWTAISRTPYPLPVSTPDDKEPSK